MKGFGFHAYSFHTRWQFRAAPEAVYDLLSDPVSYPRWWTGIRLQVRELTPGQPNGIGQKAAFFLRGKMPYELRWQLHCIDAVRPRRIVTEASGDLSGTGIWSLEPRDAGTEVSFDWKVVAQKPLLKYGSLFLRPLFIANHDWVMTCFERGLRQALEAAGERKQNV